MKKNTSVICAIAKNEQRFIREWADHYLSIGFDKLYIYEDFGSTTHNNELQDLIDEDKVALVSLDKKSVIPHYSRGTKVQLKLYEYFLAKCKEEGIADWVGFFDIDEFLVFGGGYNLQRLEKEFESEAGVVLSWIVYGANGHLERPEGGVVENYTTHLSPGFILDYQSQWCVKSLVNVKNCEGPHHIHVFKGCVNTDGYPFSIKENPPLTYSKAWINHYYSKSWEDYLERIFKRGNMQNNFRCLDKFFVCNPDFIPRKEELVFAQRYRHTAATMWVSRSMKIISGGNEQRLNELQHKYISNG